MSSQENKKERYEKLKKIYDGCKESVSIFTKMFLPHYMTVESPPFHDEIYGLLKTEKRILLAAPRGFAKSMLCSVFYPLHQVLFKLKKDVVIFSASESGAIEFLRLIKHELENNKDLIGMFGDMKSDKWTETHIILKNGTSIRAKGASGQTRGITPRPDLIICDDIEDEESVESEDRRSKLRRWLFKACINSLVPSGQFLWIGTIINHLCLINEYFQSENSFIKRRYQAYIDCIEDQEHCLWAKLWSHERLQEKKREIGSTFFATEYLNDPMSDDTAPIKPNMIRTWQSLPSQYSAVIAIDPAYSEDPKADWKVACQIYIDNNNNRYLATYVRNHKPTGEFIDEILNLYLASKGVTTAIGLPTGGGDREFYTSFKARCNERKIMPPIVELKNTFTGADGIARRRKNHRIIAALQPIFEQGRYYIHESHTEAREELLSIGSSRWDDIVDSMAYAEQLIVPYNGTQQDEPKIGRYGYEDEPAVQKANSYWY